MLSRRGAYAHQILKDYHNKIALDEILRRFQPRATALDASGVIKIGIVGAGISGLYTALMLEWLNDRRFAYDILEANPIRAGGRLYTHHFTRGDLKKGEKYDYYDVGAMRFPSIPWMKPTTDLMNHLKIPRKPYIMNDELKNNISYFNGIRLSAKEIESKIAAGEHDVFKTGLPLKDSPENIFKSIYGPFKKKLSSSDPKVWMEGLRDLRVYDDWSTRHFMRFRPNLKPMPQPDGSTRPACEPKGELTQPIISYLETIDTSTGNYDQAFVESVLDSVDFGTPNTTWEYVDGGADRIVAEARRTLKQDVQLGKRVTAIAPVIPQGKQHIEAVRLTINGNEQAHYDHVISTMSLACLGVVDLSQCNFIKPRWQTTWPIRQLRYDSSVKVAIRFSERWWERLPKPQKGGVSSTDRPTRTVVYPSYDLNGSAATIIVSYTWAQDAQRLGTGVNQGTLSRELLDVIFRDLADIHDIKDKQGIRDYNYIPKLMIEHHAWDWYNDPFSMGAFALFGPAQFTHLYPQITQPAFGRLHFAGEATSVHHAWVVGALYSAFRCLVEVFKACGAEGLIEELRSEKSPFASAGIEDNEVSQDLVKVQVALGNYYGEELAKAMLAHDSAGH